jgi:ABC-type histidine transport system ATPase subunit
MHELATSGMSMIIESGTPTQIFDGPQSDRTKLFLSQIL